ncbi:MAG TPA: hypothetical protein VEH82_10920 [Acidimicrobiales bacterium]|nr:hypothetical protein [Acidimicrobiales bacterium]
MAVTGVDLDVRPLSPTIGAEIRGVDCVADLDGHAQKPGCSAP